MKYNKVLLLVLLTGIFSTCKKTEMNPTQNADNRVGKEILDECAIDNNNIRVLFIGNSFTDNYTVKIPTMVEQLLTHNAISTDQVSSRCVSGYTLNDHLNSSTTSNFINQGNWDYVVLQENSGFLYSGGSSAEQQFENSVTSLINLIDNNSPDAKVVLYQMVPPVEENTTAYNNTQSDWNVLFTEVSGQFSNCFVVNIGEAFTKAYNGDHGFDPTPDWLRYGSAFQHHFDNTGGFLAAVTFYSAFTNEEPDIPSQMNFYLGGGNNGNAPVSSNVSQPEPLVLIGYHEGRRSVHVVPLHCFEEEGERNDPPIGG